MILNIKLVMMETVSLEQFLLSLLLGFEVKHDIIRARLIEYMIDSNNFTKLRSYIPQEYPSREAYIEAKGMANLKTWASEVELFACVQLAGKDIVCYYWRGWLRYPASGDSKKLTISALFIANKSAVYFNPVMVML